MVTTLVRSAAVPRHFSGPARCRRYGSPSLYDAILSSGKEKQETADGNKESDRRVMINRDLEKAHEADSEFAPLLKGGRR